MAFQSKLFLCFVSLGVLVSAGNDPVRRQENAMTTSIPETHVPTTLINTRSEPTTSSSTVTTALPATSISMADLHTDMAASAVPTLVASSPKFTSNAFDGNGLPIQPTITPAIAVSGVVLMITGMVYNLIGIKNLWVHVSLSAAFLTSLSITVLIEYVMKPPVSNGVQGAYFVGVFFPGLIFGGISLVFKELTEGLGCLLGGFCLSMWLLSLKDGGLLTSAAAKGSFIGAFCVVAYAFSFTSYTRPYALIASTAFAGSTAVILGLDCFSRAGLKEFWLYIWGLNNDIFPLGTTTYPMSKGIRVELAATVVIFLLGLLSQFRLWKVIRERRQKQEAILAEEQQRKDEAELELGRTLEEKKMHDLARWEAIYGGQSKRESTVGESSVSAAAPGLHRTHSMPNIMHKGLEAGLEMVALSVREADKGYSPEKREDSAKNTSIHSGAKEHEKTEEVQHVENPGADDDVDGETVHGDENEAKQKTPVRVPTPFQWFQSPPFKLPNPDGMEHGDDAHSVRAILNDDDSTANRLSRRLSRASVLHRISHISNSRRNSRHIASDSEEMLVSRPASNPASSVQGIPDDTSFEMQDLEAGEELAELHAERDTGTNGNASNQTTQPDTHMQHTSGVDGENRTPSAHEDTQVRLDTGFSIETTVEKKSEANEVAEQPRGLRLSSRKRRHTFDGGKSPFLDFASTAATRHMPGTAEIASGASKQTNSCRLSLQVQSRPQPSTNSRSSAGKKESLTAGAVEHLPGSVSPLISTYRTNEWAKHLASADTPSLEEIELSPTLVNSDEEAPVPVNVEELTQTATTASLPRVSTGRESLAGRPDAVHRTASNISKRPAQVGLSEQRPNIYIDNAATFPAIAHAASSHDLLVSNSNRSPPLYSLPGGFRSISTPFLSRSLAKSPINERQILNYDSQPTEGPLPLLAQREKMVQSRLSSVSLNRNSWMPPRSQSRKLAEEDHRTPQSSQLTLVEDDDDMPLTQRRVLLRQQSMSPVNARLSRESREIGQAKSMKMAAWRESLQEDAIRSHTPLVDVDMARQGMMDQQRRAQIAKTQRALASENLNNSIAERMRRGEMQDIHREAMRRMQAAANRKAQDGV